MNIYVLELSCYKYYVGMTRRTVEERFNEHKSGFGSCYTKLYPALRIVESFKTYDPFDEDKYVFKYMKKYGVDNVRGGSFSSIKLLGYDRIIFTKLFGMLQNDV